MATDAELNSYMGVKKYAPYRADTVDKGRGKRLWEFRETLKKRTASGEATVEQGEVKRKRKGKKERARAKDNEIPT